MKNKSIWILLIGVFFFSCNRNIEKIKATDSSTVEQASVEQFKFVHVVYFTLKEKADIDLLIKEIKKLKAIEVLHNLEIGTFADLGDKRALSQYDLVMQMDFKSRADYEIYQIHPLHLQLKKAMMNLLAGPPATYDYFKI